MLWPVLCGLGALVLRVGFALHATGMMRSKNSAGMVMRHLVDLSVGVLAFWLIGGAIVVAKPGQWVDWSLIFRPWGDSAHFLFFALSVSLIASGIVVGVAGERSKFWPMSAISILLAGVVVPVAWVWTHGWLRKLGYHDLAGAGMIHLTGAVCAAVAAVLVGPRMGKYNRDGSSNAIPGHSVPLASVGMLIVLVGWLPYVLGFEGTLRATGMAGMNVLLAGAAGCVAAVAVSQMRYAKPDIHLALAGLLGGLVAISAAADTGWGIAAVIIGAVAGVIVPVAMVLLDLVWKVDDPTGAIAIHGVGAVWGILAAGLFTPVASIGAKFKLLGVQVLGLVVMAALAALVSGGVLWVMKRVVGLRSKEADEFDGLDLAEHDIGAYPDFQQTMIKSYHLREA